MTSTCQRATFSSCQKSKHYSQVSPFDLSQHQGHVGPNFRATLAEPQNSGFLWQSSYGKYELFNLNKTLGARFCGE
jgi:hypothetical protein